MLKFLALIVLGMATSFAIAEPIVIEAEDGQNDAGNIIENEMASGGKHVEFSKTSKSKVCVIEFEVSADGTYQLWAEAQGLNGNADSFFVTIDKGEKLTWDVKHDKEKMVKQAMTQRYVKEDGKNSNKAIIVELSKGKHSIKIANRESGARLDKIYITQKGVNPFKKK